MGTSISSVPSHVFVVYAVLSSDAVVRFALPELLLLELRDLVKASKREVQEFYGILFGAGWVGWVFGSGIVAGYF